MEQLGKELEKSGNELANSLEEAFGQTGETSNVEPVNFRDLKEMLPESTGNLKRNNANGEKSSFGNIKVSLAEADYSNEDGSKTINLKITDTGTLKGFAAFGTYAWLNVEIDKESDSGYEKTLTYKGFRGYESYNNSDKSGQFTLIVGNRFVVEADGYGIDIDELHQLVDKVDLNKLDGMKTEGVASK